MTLPVSLHKFKIVITWFLLKEYDWPLFKFKQQLMMQISHTLYWYPANLTREAAGESCALIQAKPACLIIKSYAPLTKIQRWFRVFSNHWYWCKANMAEKKMKQNAYYHKIFDKFPFSRKKKSILCVFKSFQYIINNKANIKANSWIEC